LLIFLGYENSIMACGIAAEREEGVEWKWGEWRGFIEK
jgi:hypothetical protein